MQQIIIQGLKAQGKHGVGPEERSVAQEFEVDIVVQPYSPRAQATDELSDTVDYAAVCSRAESIVRDRSFALLERLAAEIADSVLGMGGVQRVEVTVKKMHPPLSHRVDFTAVRVTRSR